MKKTLSGKRLAWLLTLAYFASYITRINFAAVTQEIVTDTGLEKSSLSVILVCLFVTYGTGQIINGRIGDKIKPQNLILCGLVLSTVINAMIPFVPFSIPLMCVLWGINGFAQAMMWPPMVRIMVSTMDEKMYGYAVVRVSWGSSAGTVAVYLAAPLLITLWGWRAVFIACAALGAVVTAIWWLCKDRIELADTAPAEKLQDSGAPVRAKPAGFIFPLVFISLAVMLQGMLRDGVTSWMPTYLAEVFGFGNSVSILCTVSLAVFSIVSFFIVGALYRRFFVNEVTFGGGIFAVGAISALALYFLYGFGAVPAVICMTLITGCMHGVNLMLITHVPKRFRRFGNISTVSGAVNACTYVGSAVSTYGIARLSEVAGWHATVGIWFAVAACGTACCFIAAKSWRKFIRTESISENRG